MRARVLGAVAVVAVVALDQAAKFARPPRFRRDRGGAGAADAVPRSRLALEPRHFLQPVRASNSAAGRWLLLALTLVVTALLGSGCGARGRRWSASASALIIGGAIGNGYDRLAYGAVVDFLDLHAFGRHFFVFNVADAAINIGVALLIVDGLVGARGRPAPGSGRGKGK